MQTLLEVGIVETQTILRMLCLELDTSFSTLDALWFGAASFQTEIALSTMEAEYIALSQAMREVIPLIALMDELESLIRFFNPTPQICCKLFEDNRSCIIVAEPTRLTSRTKHVTIKYHYFCQFVKNGSVKIYPIGTREQVAEILTKPLDEGQFKYLHNLFLRW